jgi:hypothetical protein
MNWKLARIDWHPKGQCWTWWKIRKNSYFQGNQVQWTWGRISFVFERRDWTY